MKRRIRRAQHGGDAIESKAIELILLAFGKVGTSLENGSLLGSTGEYWGKDILIYNVYIFFICVISTLCDYQYDTCSTSNPFVSPFLKPPLHIGEQEPQDLTHWFTNIYKKASQKPTFKKRFHVQTSCYPPGNESISQLWKRKWMFTKVPARLMDMWSFHGG